MNHLEIASNDQEVHAIPPACLARLSDRGVDGVEGAMSLSDGQYNNTQLNHETECHPRNLRPPPGRLASQTYRWPCVQRAASAGVVDVESSIDGGYGHKGRNFKMQVQQ
jgi:hypothetical protein